MKTGLMRIVHVYDMQEMKREVVEFAMPGDYFNAEMWCKSNLEDMEEQDPIRYLLQTFAWVWFAFVRLGKAKKYGIEGELSQEALVDLANRISVYMEEVPDDVVPLVSETQQKK